VTPAAPPGGTMVAPSFFLQSTLGRHNEETEMFKKIATMIGYAKAPKATYLVKHPVEGTKNLLALRGARSLLKGRAGAIAAGVAASAAAVPLAIIMGKKIKR
jgi:hypothetical protein